jgi:hypothetical protein
MNGIMGSPVEHTAAFEYRYLEANKFPRGRSLFDAIMREYSAAGSSEADHGFVGVETFGYETSKDSAHERVGIG